MRQILFAFIATFFIVAMAGAGNGLISVKSPGDVNFMNRDKLPAPGDR